MTITIIGILAALAWGAVVMARNAANEAATKATIAKLHSVIMKRYESYMTRRMPIKIPPGTTATAAAQIRLNAIGEMMRMEMPVSAAEINLVPQVLPAPPSLALLYRASPPSNIDESAQCLYLIVSKGSPEAMEQFNASEIGVTDGKPVFVDGWKRPIKWSRSTPGVAEPLPYIFSDHKITNQYIEQR